MPLAKIRANRKYHNEPVTVNRIPIRMATDDTFNSTKRNRPNRQRPMKPNRRMRTLKRIQTKPRRKWKGKFKRPCFIVAFYWWEAKEFMSIRNIQHINSFASHQPIYLIDVFIAMYIMHRNSFAQHSQSLWLCFKRLSFWRVKWWKTTPCTYTHTLSWCSVQGILVITILFIDFRLQMRHASCASALTNESDDDSAHNRQCVRISFVYFKYKLQ